MEIITPDICDLNPDKFRVFEAIFKNYGGRKSFYGQAVTMKCHEDNSVVKEQANHNGKGKVMVVDGGGSLRCALLGDMIAEQAAKNAWEGIIIYGAIRDVDAVAKIDLGVQALATVPIKSNRQGRGDLHITLRFAGNEIEENDYIYADNNGIIVSKAALNLP